MKVDDDPKGKPLFATPFYMLMIADNDQYIGSFHQTIYQPLLMDSLQQTNRAMEHHHGFNRQNTQQKWGCPKNWRSPNMVGFC